MQTSASAFNPSPVRYWKTPPFCADVHYEWPLVYKVYIFSGNLWWWWIFLCRTYIILEGIEFEVGKLPNSFFRPLKLVRNKGQQFFQNKVLLYTNYRIIIEFSFNYKLYCYLLVLPGEKWTVATHERDYLLPNRIRILQGVIGFHNFTNLGTTKLYLLKWYQNHQF